MSEYLELAKEILGHYPSGEISILTERETFIAMLAAIAQAEAAERQASALERIAAKLDKWDNADKHGNFAGLLVALRE